jgi:hypothetical protein
MVQLKWFNIDLLGRPHLPYISRLQSRLVDLHPISCVVVCGTNGTFDTRALPVLTGGSFNAGAFP